MTDDTTTSPRLFVHCCMGSVGEVAPTLSGKLQAVHDADFDGIESWVGNNRTELRELARAAKDLGLRLGGAGHLPVDADPEPLFALAADAGAQYVELQVDGYWQTDAWILDRTRSLMRLANAHAVPFFLETHRGRYTQDMRRTLWLLHELPDVQLCGDFSHYASSCELIAPWPAAWKQPLYDIARRCRMLHGRMNRGQRVQDPIGTIPPAQIDEFLSAWKEAFTASGCAGATSFTVTTELLGPDYQLIVAGEPFGDLWGESCWLRELVIGKLTPHLAAAHDHDH